MIVESIEEEAMSIAEAAAWIAGAAESLHYALIFACDLKYSCAQAMRARMENYREEGALILEISTKGMTTSPEHIERMRRKAGWEQWRGPLDRLGFFIQYEIEFRPDDPLMRGPETGEQYGARVPLVTIRTLDGLLRRWEDFRFIRVLKGTDF